MKQLKILKQRKKFQKCQYVFKPFFVFLKNTSATSNGFKLCQQNNSMITKNSSLLRTANNTDTASFLRCRGVT